MPIKDRDAARAAWRKWYATGDNAIFYRKRAHKKRRELREWFAQFKATLRCSRCPESDPVCLDFHHRNPAEKDFSIYQALNRKASKKSIMAEVAKCEILCANCHRKEHRENMGQHKRAKSGTGSNPAILTNSLEAS